MDDVEDMGRICDEGDEGELIDVEEYNTQEGPSLVANNSFNDFDRTYVSSISTRHREQNLPSGEESVSRYVHLLPWAKFWFYFPCATCLWRTDAPFSSIRSQTESQEERDSPCKHEIQSGDRKSDSEQPGIRPDTLHQAYPPCPVMWPDAWRTLAESFDSDVQRLMSTSPHGELLSKSLDEKWLWLVWGRSPRFGNVNWMQTGGRATLNRRAVRLLEAHPSLLECYNMLWENVLIQGVPPPNDGF